MKKTLLVLIFSFGTTCLAETTVTELAKCEHKDVTGFGATMADARKEASTKCFDRLVQQFEQTRKRLPTADEADLLLTEQCLNICS